MVSSLLLGTLLMAKDPVLVQGHPAPAHSQSESKKPEPPWPRVRTAVGFRLSLWNSSIVLRQHWSERFSTDLLGYALFGRGHGNYRAGLQLRYVVFKSRRFWFHAAAPAIWRQTRGPTPVGLNIRPEPVNQIESSFSLGVGPGLEVFLHPLASLTLDLPFAWQWRTDQHPTTNHRHWESRGMVPFYDLSFHVYFR